jgi:hypothetical protein
MQLQMERRFLKVLYNLCFWKRNMVKIICLKRLKVVSFRKYPVILEISL